MDINLVQKLTEEELFPHASRSEQRRREKEVVDKMYTMDTGELIDILADRCMKYFNEVHVSPDNSDFREYIIDGLEHYKGMNRDQAKAALKQYYYPANEPIEPEFFESKVNEEELFPQASEGDIKQREIELEKKYPLMNTDELLDVLADKCYKVQENPSPRSLYLFVLNGLRKYKKMSGVEAEEIAKKWFEDTYEVSLTPIPGDKLFNQVYKALNGQ